MQSMHHKSIQLRHPRCARADRPRLVGARAAAVEQDNTASAVEADAAKLRPVDRVVSARVTFDDKGEPLVQYLAKWKEDETMTWEPSENLSEDLVRDFEEAFWQACKMGDMTFLSEALRWGGATLANLLNAEGRAPLHLAAALNHRAALTAILEAGAEVDVQDPEGYTPLHMASGYLHVEAVNDLLAAGADLTKPDRSGRDTRDLIASIREKMTSASAIQQRMKLEQVSKALMYFLYEDVAPAAVLRKREPAIGEEGPTMYLVRWRDGAADSWLPAEYLSDEVKEDFEAGLEYAEAESITDSRETEDCGREYLVTWSDGAQPSWESEDNLTSALVRAYETSSKSGQPPAAAAANGTGDGAAAAPAQEQQKEAEAPVPA